VLAPFVSLKGWRDTDSMSDPQAAGPDRHLSRPPRPQFEPVALTLVDRSHRGVLENLGQLYRHDLSEAYGHLPNLDGTFNNRRLDQFLAGVDSSQQMWLITVAGGLGGFVLTRETEGGGRTISDFFVVRALRRTGVGREAARRVIAMTSGRWRIAFQTYNPGAEAFWQQVATDAAGNTWNADQVFLSDGSPPDSWITFGT
jgi:predicted acetyltransferase